MFGAKTGVTVSNKYHTQLKKVFAVAKNQNSQRRCYLKEGMQRPAQVFSCEYCEIFKKTYFEKHLWTAGSENQDFSDKFTQGTYFPNFIILLIETFSIKKSF